MAGRDHTLISAVAVAQNRNMLWSHCDRAVLTMASLDETLLTAYEARAGEALTASAGGYWLEDVGSWLFDRVEGDYFTVLGMPLLPLLAYLRNVHRVLPA